MKISLAKKKVLHTTFIPKHSNRLMKAREAKVTWYLGSEGSVVMVTSKYLSASYFNSNKLLLRLRKYLL